mmetsp:Transcript_49605/g.50432  ORF Transcript_49605/g.50432 Transcript_49605/m.50432 type:complete len:151 (+) Transcript_49605:271-723(+)
MCHGSEDTMDIPDEKKYLVYHTQSNPDHLCWTPLHGSNQITKETTTGADKAYALNKYTAIPNEYKNQRSAVLAVYFPIYTVEQLYLIRRVKANGRRKANDELTKLVIIFNEVPSGYATAKIIQGTIATNRVNKARAQIGRRRSRKPSMMY